MKLTVLICTHNRVGLLRRTLDHLNRARRPAQCPVEVLVLANACTDATHEFLESYIRERHDEDGATLPLRWAAEATPGKSHALNRAIAMLEAGCVAFVDDDHRVHEDYLVGICRAAQAFPDTSLFCGRILPDWEGSEPAWVHDTGPFRIYPLPVPRYDLGDASRLIVPGKSTPGGGNLVVRTTLFGRVGPFSTDYGPVGHDLGGGEDQEWIMRALDSGATLRYVPDIVQYHYVDPDRLRLGYLLRKAYERSASVVRLSAETAGHGPVPPYMINKLMRYALAALLSSSRQEWRFHLVRLAACLGEIKGHVMARRERGGRRDVREAK